MKRTAYLLLLVFTGLHSATRAQFQGNALDFDGANDRVTASLPPLFNSLVSADFTFEAWVYPRGTTFSRIFFAQSSATNFATVSTSNSNQIYFYVVANGTNYSMVTGNAMPSNQWTHLAARWNASTQTVEVLFNGVLQTGTGGGTSSNGTSGLMVLGSRPDGNQYFNGILDEARVWSEVRSTCEIQSNMQNSISGLHPNLVASYTFNQGTGGGNNAGITTLPDVTNGTFNGTLVDFGLAGATSNWVVSGATVATSGGPLGGFATSSGAHVCFGESFTFPDGSTQSNITAQVVHVSNLNSTNGCDSVVTTTVDVLPVYQIAESASICAGENFTFPDGSVQNNITAQVVYTSSFQSVTGCDSLIETTVDVLPVYQIAESASICAGENFTFPDGSVQNNITAQVVYTSSFQSVTGCDSLIETTVNVLPVYQIAESASICAGESFTFPDGSVQNNITAQVVYTSALQSVAGCDSLIETTVSVLTVNTGINQNGPELTAQASGAAYQWINCSTNQPIAGATAQSFTATQNGDFAVIVSDGNCSDTSSCASVTTIGLTEVLSRNMLVYPNPTAGFVTIKAIGLPENAPWLLTDQLGRILATGVFTGTTTELDLSAVPAGVYLVRIDGSAAATRITKR